MPPMDGVEILGVEPDSAARVAGSAPLLGRLGMRNAALLQTPLVPSRFIC